MTGARGPRRPRSGSGSGAGEPNPHRWRILSVSLAVGFMSLLDVTIVNVALPSMRTGLDADVATIQWVVSGYALTFGLVLVAGGRLGDAYGRRRMMLLGLTGFILASAAVGFAPTAELVVVARLAQGASAGLLAPQNSGLIQELFTGEERGRAFGLFGFTVSISSALGPVLGGAVIALAGSEDGWRWLFWVNIPIGIAALVAIARLVPSEPPGGRADRVDIDVGGAVLLGATVLVLLYPLVSLESGQRLPLVLLVAVPPLAWAFVRWEFGRVRAERPPLLDVALLRRLPGYAEGLAVGALYFTGFTGVLLVLSVFLQEGLGASALATGLLLTPFALGSAITSPVAGRLVTRFGRRVTLVSLTTMMSGLVLVAAVAPGRDLDALAWLLVPMLLLAGLGGGGVISPNFALTLQEVPTRMAGAAGGALQTGQRIGSSFGAAALMTVYGVAVASGADPGTALRAALATALVALALALTVAVRSRRTERRAARRDPGPL